MTKSIIKHVTPANGNVFLDIGFPQEEAAALLADSTRIIAEKVAIKESLMTELSLWIDKKKLKQADAARQDPQGERAGRATKKGPR